MNSSSFHNYAAGTIGALLKHYNNALLGLLAPFIAPLFFKTADTKTALFLMYAILPLGFLTRPIGAIFFGIIGDRFGRKKALLSSLLGMTLISMSIGSLPTYEEIGVYSPLLLTLGKLLKSFFAAGECSGGAIFILEHTSNSKRGLVSSFYGACSMTGVIIASASVAFMSGTGNIEENWRFLFWAGGIIALPGIFLRMTVSEPTDYTQIQNVHFSDWFLAIKKHKTVLLSIILASGFSYANYSLAFTLMNGYIPLVTTAVSKEELMKLNTYLLVFDMLLLPCFGYLAHRFGNAKVMLFGALLSALTAIPLYALLDQATFEIIFIVRLSLILFGVAFAAPYHAWVVEQTSPSHRFFIVSLGVSIGSQLIGGFTSSISLWLYLKTGWCAAPGFYLLAVGLGAVFAIYRLRDRSAYLLAKP